MNIEKLIRPDSDNSKCSRSKLITATIDSTISLLDGLRQIKSVNNDIVDLSKKILNYAHNNPSKYFSEHNIIDGAFFEWYYQAINYLNKQDFDNLVKHYYKLPYVLSEITLTMQLSSKRLIFADETGQIFLYNYFSLGHYQPFERIELDFEDETIFSIKPKENKYSLDDIRKYGVYQIPDSNIFIKQVGKGRERIISKYQSNLKAVADDDVPFEMISPEKLIKHKLITLYINKFEEALKYIKKIDIDLYQETNVLTRDITLLRGFPFIGGSSLNHFGTSFFNLLPEWSIECYADHIVHEAAHQKIHSIFELEPILLNPNDTLAKSPIRPDKRPLEGIFHATFVFYRLSHFFFKAVENHYSKEGEIRLHRHLLGFYAGVDQLIEFGKFTPIGIMYVDYLQKEKSRFKKCIEFPEATLYNQIPIDYEKPRNLTFVTE
ncbi:aKG-HExxH-type peptide beta-hydroxylase [Tenacibaculum aestuariivivum]|uniref:aKG-HExxH-type peptide beta-hydroxylase n=1 Tax=Tenacibaculum aestuariivivum TaxID=2006131 RepID=UPI003AB72054